MSKRLIIVSILLTWWTTRERKEGWDDEKREKKKQNEPGTRKRNSRTDSDSNELTLDTHTAMLWRREKVFSWSILDVVYTLKLLLSSTKTEKIIFIESNSYIFSFRILIRLVRIFYSTNSQKVSISWQHRWCWTKFINPPPQQQQQQRIIKWTFNLIPIPHCRQRIKRQLISIVFYKNWNRLVKFIKSKQSITFRCNRKHRFTLIRRVCWFENYLKHIYRNCTRISSRIWTRRINGRRTFRLPFDWFANDFVEYQSRDHAERDDIARYKIIEKCDQREHSFTENKTGDRHDD